MERYRKSMRRSGALNGREREREKNRQRERK